MKTLGGGRVRYVGLAVEEGSPRRCVRGGALEVWWGDRRMERFEVREGDELRVEDGAEVGPETWLCWSERLRYHEETTLPALDALRRFLDGRTPGPGVAPTAPCDASVVAVRPSSVTLASERGEVAVRTPKGSVPVVRAGDRVFAGDALTQGHRSHHRLLRAWGEERLAEHLLDELQRECGLRGLEVPRVYWSLVVRAMLAWRRVRDPGDTGLRRNQVLARDVFEGIQRETRSRGGAPATAVTVLRGLRWLARTLPPTGAR